MSLWVAYLIKEDEVRVEDGYIVCRIVSNLPRELHNAPVVIQGRDVDHLNEESRGQDRRVILVEFDVQSVFVFFPNKEVLQDSASRKKKEKCWVTMTLGVLIVSPASYQPRLRTY